MNRFTQLYCVLNEPYVGTKNENFNICKKLFNISRAIIIVNLNGNDAEKFDTGHCDNQLDNFIKTEINKLFETGIFLNTTVESFNNNLTAYFQTPEFKDRVNASNASLINADKVAAKSKKSKTQNLTESGNDDNLGSTALTRTDFAAKTRANANEKTPNPITEGLDIQPDLVPSTSENPNSALNSNGLFSPESVNPTEPIDATLLTNNTSLQQSNAAAQQNPPLLTNATTVTQPKTNYPPKHPSEGDTNDKTSAASSKLATSHGNDKNQGKQSGCDLEQIKKYQNAIDKNGLMSVNTMLSASRINSMQKQIAEIHTLCRKEKSALKKQGGNPSRKLKKVKSNRRSKSFQRKKSKRTRRINPRG